MHFDQKKIIKNRFVGDRFNDGFLETVAVFTKIVAEIKLSKNISALVKKFLEPGEL